MSSSRAYLEFILEQLSELEDITYRYMMSEYIIYYKGKIIGGIYDDRFLVKVTKASEEMIDNNEKDIPYPGAKEMILVDNLDDKQFLKSLIEAMYEQLPMNKKKK